MDVDLDVKAESFRAELRAWLGAHFTAEVAERVDGPGTASLTARRGWNAELVDAGYGAVSWPVEHGGRAAGISEQIVWYEEMARAGAPGPVNVIGMANIAPAIMAHGTEAQRRRFLRPMLRGEEIWSQGMSEPDAGSDLAALRCTAVLDGDDYVVTGQKTWNSLGAEAGWCQLFVRTNTDVPKHKGITCLLVDLSSPGIEARPIRTMAGEVGFAELFFDGARVPRSAALGEVDGGWRIATATLSNERAGVAGLYLGVRDTFDRLVDAVPGGGLGGGVARDALAARFVAARNLEFLAKRMLGAALAGRPPGAEGSAVKLAWAQCGQDLAVTALDVLGPAALGGPWAESVSSSRALSIAGGTTEVNKNIIGERVLGLPREPAPQPD